MNKQFLLAGMFRSGTTMLARMLHSNPNIVCASDPFLPIFKSFRNTIANELFGKVDSNAPLNDYFFDKNQNNLYQEIQNRSFSISVPKGEIIKLREQIEIDCKPYSPLIIPFLKKLDGETYSDLFLSAFEIINQSYGKKSAKVIGIKEVWVYEFSKHFQKLKSDNKIIHIIRDPRSVVASNYASGGTYPLIFLIRQWRKAAILAMYHANNSIDMRLLIFEEVLSNPEKKAREMCKFLEVDFHENMTDPSSYIDGIGEPWRQNSSFHINKNDRTDFNPKAKDSWKKVLNDEVLYLIELFCGNEMKLLGYETNCDIGILQKYPQSLLDFEDDVSNFSEWIKPYANYDYNKEIQSEIERLEMTKSKLNLSTQAKKLLFLEPSFSKMLDL
jgi:hypothetical protein